MTSFCLTEILSAQKHFTEELTKIYICSLKINCQHHLWDMYDTAVQTSVLYSSYVNEDYGTVSSWHR